MNRFLLFLFCLIAAGEISYSQPSVTAGTGALGFNLSSYGRLRANAGAFVSASREVDRMTLIVSQSQNAVFDYQNDADSTVEVAESITIPGVDVAAQTVVDNEYSALPPRIKARITVMGWTNQKYLIVRYTIIADTINLGSLYHGVIVIPRVGAIYGGETVKYSGARKAAYYFREGENSYWGVKALNPQVFGVRSLDWDEYSTNPNGDAATDSLRELMTKYSSFDSLVVAGSNGSIYSVNTGKNTFTNAGDSTRIYFALAYGTSETDLFASLDSATAKFGAISTSVRRDNEIIPGSYSLEQNYPNPFNPSTQISFSIASSQHVRLTVSDALGREVSTVVNGGLDAGEYSVPFDASRLSAGVYYYTLRAGSFVQTKRMVLVK
jgi:hypothetical protein